MSDEEPSQNNNLGNHEDYNFVNGEVSDEEDDQNEDGGYTLLPQSSEEEGEASDPSVVTLLTPQNNQNINEPLIEESQVEIIRQAMIGFTLSNTPNWAQNLPEDVWKKELLDGIRKHGQK